MSRKTNWILSKQLVKLETTHLCHMTGFCEHWQWISRFHKRRKFINQLSDCQLIIKDPATWSSVRFRRPTSRKASVHEEAFVLLEEPTTQWRFAHKTCTQTARELCHLTDSDATYWNYSSNFVDSFHVRCAGCPRQTVCYIVSVTWNREAAPRSVCTHSSQYSSGVLL